MAITLEGGDYDFENIFDQNDDPVFGKVYLTQSENLDYFIRDVYPKEVEEEASKVMLTIQGFRFQQGTRVVLQKEWQADITAWVMDAEDRNAYEIEVMMTLENAAPGYYDVIVINPDGQIMELKKGFRILGAESQLSEEEALLVQNFPNPFSEETEIRFAVPQVIDVKVEVLDKDGFSLTLLDQKLTAGRHSVIWNI